MGQADPHETRPEEHDGDGKDPPVVLDAQKIFEGRREVLIELDGVRYRLRITRRNKLILQK